MGFWISIGVNRGLNFKILLDSRYISTIIMVKITWNIKIKRDTTTQCRTQTRKLTSNKNVNIDFFGPKFSTTTIVKCKLHLGDFSEFRWHITLGRDLLMALWVYIKFQERLISGGYGPYKGCTSLKVYLNYYDLIILK